MVEYIYIFFGFLKSLLSDLKKIIFSKKDCVDNKTESTNLNTNNVLNIVTGK